MMINKAKIVAGILHPKRQDIVVFILAAGKSSRMGMKTAKVLLPVGGRPMIYALLELAQTYAGNNVYVVVSPDLKTHLEAECVYPVVQDQPMGTGHAFALAFQQALAQDPDLLSKKILVLLGDTPLIQACDLAALLDPDMHHNQEVVVVGMQPPCPHGYGRLCMDNGRLMRIVETKDATDEEKEIALCNTGVMCLRADFAQQVIEKFEPSAVTGEWYLTDVVRHAQHASVVHGQWESFKGINTRTELIQAEALLQKRFREKAIQDGAYLMSPETTFLSYDTQCAPNVVIYPMVCCGPGVRLDEGVTVYSGSVLERSHIKKSSSIGPFARIRPGTVVGPWAEVGNFVETKNAVIGAYSQVKHLSYIGDAVLGEHVNVGAGVITCNYDGHAKNRTHLDDGVFVGSHTAFIAPVQVGKNSTIGAGSIITKSVDSETLALSRAEQKSYPLRVGTKHLLRKKKTAPEDGSAPAVSSSET